MLSIFGIDYKTSSLDLRDQLSYTSYDIEVFIQKVKNAGICREIIILSTCNRIEVYSDTNDVDFLINTFLEYKHICPYSSSISKQSIYIYYDYDMVEHIFNVTSGLSSMVLGESEIVSQVKDAINLSTKLNSMGVNLRIIFEMSLSVSKEVRANTGLSNSSISMGRAISLLIEKNQAKIDNSLLVIGAGNMIKHIAPYVFQLSFKNKTLINRDSNKGVSVAKICGAEYQNFDSLSNIASKYDVIIIAVSSNEIILTRDMFQNIDPNLMIIDLSMPLVTDKELYQQVKFFSIDDIKDIVEVGVDTRKLASDMASKIIKDKIDEYKMWQKKRNLSPIIKELRSHIEQIRLEVLNEFIKNNMSEESKLSLEDLSIKLTNRFLHMPTVNLCSFNQNNFEQLTELVSVLFGINKKVG
jgi:glutamyl-tRNA reductase